MTQRIAIVDLGSNSARLIVTHVYHNGAYNLVYEQKETVRLSRGLTEDGGLLPEAMEKAIEALKNFAYMCRLFAADIIIGVATAAVRNASNGLAFVEQIRQETGITLRIISGDEEAWLGYLGVINTIDAPDALIFDLGGGSTELALVRNRLVVHTASLPFGAVNTTALFKTRDRISQTTFTELTHYIQEQLKALPWIKNTDLPLIGIGGTTRNLAKIDQRRKQYPYPKLHNYRMGKLSFEDLLNLLLGTNFSQRKKIPGLNADRADIMLAGSTIVHALFETTGSNRLIISGCGVREGLFMQHYLKQCNQPVILNDLLEHSTQNMLLFYKADEQHAHHVADIADLLFAKLEPFHRLEPRERALLRVAALLHDIGISINYYDHSRHSAYLIENARLFGLTHREQMLASVVAGWHNGASIKYFRNRIYSEFLDEIDWKNARKMALMLALAEALDETQTSAIQRIELAISDNKKKMTVLYEADGQCHLEILAAAKRARWFKKEFGAALEFAPLTTAD